MTTSALTQTEFLKNIVGEYRGLGYEILPKGHFQKELGYEPDLVVRKGDEITVVEVTSGRRQQKQSIRNLRERAETKGYRFELKVVPVSPPISNAVDDIGRVPRLVAEAEECIANEKYDLALLLAWIAIEISIRQITASQLGPTRLALAPGEIIRMAAEFELVGTKDRLWLRSVADIRNRVTHGFRTDVGAALAKKVLAFAKKIARKARLYGKGRLAA